MVKKRHPKFLISPHSLWFCEKRNLQLGLNESLELLLDSVHIDAGRDPRRAVCPALGESKILGHDTVVDGVNARLLELLGEGDELGGVVELAALDETTGPGKDGSDGVGGGLLALLVLAPVAGDGAVG
jgi:hypothetical protein